MFRFALSDALKNLYEFELTARHVPIHDQCLPAYTIVSPSELDRRPARNRVSSNVMSRFEQVMCLFGFTHTHTHTYIYIYIYIYIYMIALVQEY